MRYVRCFLAIAALSWAAAANAQDLTLYGGFHNPGALQLSPAVGGIRETARQPLTDPRNFGVFGVRLYNSDAPLGFEHTVSFSPNFVNSDAWAILAHSNLRAEAPATVIRPYVTAGLGVLYAAGDGLAAIGGKFGWNYGGGVRASVMPPVGVRIDVRGYSIRGVQDQTLRIWETSVGVFFSF